MKNAFASLVVTLLSAPVAVFGCDGGTTGFDLPAPVPPTRVESVIGSVSNNAGLFIGLALGTVIGAVLARRRKLGTATSLRPLENPSA